MGRTFHPLAIATITAVLGACNGSQKPVKGPEPPAPTSVDGTPAPAPDGGGSADLAPVPEIGELIVHVRWKSPAATIAQMARFAKQPGSAADTMVHEIAAGFLSEAIGGKVKADQFADVVAADAPIDIIVVADTSKNAQVPAMIAAWSVGLSSLDRALAASKGEPKKLAGGAFKIGTSQKWGAPCAVAPSVGRSPARLVCTEKDKNLEKVTGYLTRNVAALPDPASDIHGEVKLRGLLDKYGRSWANQARGLPILADELKLKIPVFDDAVAEAAAALASEAGNILADADGVVLDAKLDEQRGLTVSATLKFADKKSWIVQTILDGSDQAGAAPDLFWNAPKDADTLSYSHGGDPARWEPILRVGRGLIEGGLEHENVATAGDRKAIAGLLKLPFKKNAVTVMASGHFDDQPGTKNAVQDIANAALGWSIIGVDDKPAVLKAYFDEAVKTYNRQSLQSWFKKEMGAEDSKHLPIAKTGKAPAALGKDSMAIEITVPAIPEIPQGGPTPPDQGKPKTVDVKAYILIMGDGDRTWLGFAADRDGLAKLMAQAKGATPGADTIASNAALGRFKNEKHSALTVTSIEGLVGMLKPGLMATMRAAPGAPNELQQILAIIEKMPNKGTSLIVGSGDVNAGSKPTLTVGIEVPKGAVEDAAYLITSGMQMAARSP
jgi:hypothetical protein